MASLDIKNIANWSLTKKIISGVILLLVVWILWSIFGGVNAATQRILELPDGSVQIVNDDGKTINLEIKVGNSDSNFSKVSKSVVEKTVLYSGSSYPASAATVIEDVNVPIEVALFNGEGNLIKIYNIPANTKKTCNPDKKYQYTIMAAEGFFEDKGISLENSSKLLPDTVNKTSE